MIIIIEWRRRCRLLVLLRVFFYLSFSSPLTVQKSISKAFKIACARIHVNVSDDDNNSITCDVICFFFFFSFFLCTSFSLMTVLKCGLRTHITRPVFVFSLLFCTHHRSIELLMSRMLQLRLRTTFIIHVVMHLRFAFYAKRYISTLW